MRLHELTSNAAANKSKKRKGRGIGSGLGKTAGRGHGGQGARSNRGARRGFEGGQMPLQQRLPKRGFTNIFRKEYAEVNIETLNRLEEGTQVTPELLKETGIIKEIRDGVKILGNGELNKKLEVSAHKFSKTAAEKIEAAGGKIEVI